MQPEAQAALRRLWLKQEQSRYQQRVQAQPDNVPAWQQLARISWEAGELESALAAFEQVLVLQPEDGESLLGRVMACLALGRNEEALATSAQILKVFPDHADTLLYQIEALRRLGYLAEALRICDRLLALPDLDLARQIAVLTAKALTLDGLNRIQEALVATEQGLNLAPGHPALTLHHAILLEQLERFAEALDVTESLIAGPRIPLGALCVKARVLAVLRHFNKADAILQELQDHYPHRQLEQVFEPWRFPEETLPDSLPKRYTARGLYLMQFFRAQADFDWRDREFVLANIEELTADALHYGFVAGMEPFNLLTLPLDPALQSAVAHAQATAVAARMAPIRKMLPIEWPSTPREGRLRIGYVSGDFREHPTAHLARKLFQVHDRTKFEIFGFSLRPSDNSYYWQDIADGCDQFVELAGLSHTEAAARIAQEGIHILVDMHGYTRFARPELFALRPAPLQVSFLGYPGTLGADYIPYLIADRIVLPKELQRWFTEHPIYIDCYQVNDDEQPVATTGITRADAGLPEYGFVYCCFNNPSKIDPQTFAVWMRIMKQVPDSVLWLLASSSHGIDRLRREAGKYGIDPERLVFASRLPKDKHLERHRLADLFLDTFVYNAHTTASDALWAGLPILTLQGTTFQSRVCASLLTALGLEELTIAKNEHQYEEWALMLSSEPTRLQELRFQLDEKRRTGLPFATAWFARQLEQAFLALWAAYSERKK